MHRSLFPCVPGNHDEFARGLQLGGIALENRWLSVRRSWAYQYVLRLNHLDNGGRCRHLGTSSSVTATAAADLNKVTRARLLIQAM